MANVSESDQNEAIAELAKVRSDWMKRAGVNAVDVGFKYTNGVRTDVLAIRAHVDRKLPLEGIPEHDRFPSQLGRFPVDVIEADYGPQAVE